MIHLLTCNISTLGVLDGQDAWTPRPYFFNESIGFSLRFLRNENGQAVEPDLDIQATKASIGELDARPASGTWKLQIGGGVTTPSNTTGALQHDCSAEDLQGAINALSAVTGLYGAAKVRKEDGSWTIVFGTGGAEVAMEARENKLAPLSFLRTTAAVQDSVWQHALRLIQLPPVFTDVAARVLPPPPETSILRPGGEGGGFKTNQQQLLYVPPSFRGSYYLQTASAAQTIGLSQEDTAETVQAALETILGTGNVTVTDEALGSAIIELTGTLAGTNPDALTVVPFNPPPGDLTLTLALTTGELEKLLRASATKSVTLPIEVRIYLGEDLDELVVILQNVTIVAPQAWPELASTPNVDWLLPPSPRDYLAFNPANVITGQQYYGRVIGDGALTHFVITHGLATAAVYVFVRENVSGGRMLIHGVDYTVTAIHTADVTINALLGAPSLNAWAVLVVSAAQVSAFADGLTIEIDQVTGLAAQLTALGASVTALQALAPTTPLGTSTSTTDGVAVEIQIADYAEQFPKFETKDDTGKVLRTRPGLLWPAVHDATVTNFSSTLPDVTSSAGQVNSNTGSAILVPGGGASPSSFCANGEFVASDGRRVYPVSQDGVSNSYFPRDFERELFMFEISSQMLRAGTMLSLALKLALYLQQANTRMQALMVLQHGAVVQDASPSPIGANLQKIAWNATPIFSQRVILGSSKVVHSFGAQIIRAANGTLSANKLLYGYATAAGAVPASADFALRGLLLNWDTENAIADARGIISAELTEASATIA